MDEAGSNLLPITNPGLGHGPDDASGCTGVPIGAPGGALGVGAGATGDVVKQHRSCIGCGYDLFGLQKEGLCPECGRPVAATLAIPLVRELGSAGRTIRTAVAMMALAVWLFLAAGLALVAVVAAAEAADAAAALAVEAVGQAVGQAVVPALAGTGLLLYVLGWSLIAIGVSAAHRCDDQIKKVFPKLALFILLSTAVIASGAFVAVLVIPRGYLLPGRVFLVILSAVTFISSGVHCLGLPMALSALRRLVDGDPSKVARVNYVLFTFILHGVFLLWSLAIAIIMFVQARSTGYANDFDFVAVYITVPFHLAWLLTTAIIFTLRAVQMNREVALMTPRPAPAASKGVA